MRAILVAFAFLFIACGSREAPVRNETERIERLLARIVESEVTFLRNGREHTAHEAVDHLRSKWKAAGDRVKTAEDFIDQLATRSSSSGTPYRVRLHDGSERESGPWLHEQLRK